MIDRKILKKFRSWLQRENRKPLILRGARQVGKTTVVNMFGKEFKQYIYLNMEKKADRELFEQNLSIDKLIQAICFIKGANQKEESTLIFIDEIQNSAEAVKYLRFFYEEAPSIPVIAAGSLLEVFLKKFKITFPVGRVDYMYLYPVDFEEYLGSLKNQSIREAYKEIPLPEYAHSTLLEYFHEYSLIGGMPAVCSDYLENRDLNRLSSIYESLLTSYIDDAAKYAGGSGMYQVIRHAIESVPLEAGNRIKFQGFGKSNYRSREIGEALRTLERAMLLYLLYPVTSMDIPCLPDRKKSPRLQFLDTGLLNYHAGIQNGYIGLKDLNALYRGKLTEHIVGQELQSKNLTIRKKNLFWVREKSGSSAEIDFVIPWESHLIPVEIKSGKTGTLRSLHLFMEGVNHTNAVRLYSDRIHIENITTTGGKEYTLLNLPYYLSGKIDEYLEYYLNR